MSRTTISTRTASARKFSTGRVSRGRADDVRIVARPRATLSLSVAWEPTEHEIEEKLIELAYTWGDIEEETGSQVFSDPQGCVAELRDVLRAVPARG